MRRLSLGILAFALLGASAARAAPVAPQALGDPWKICAAQAARHEAKHGLPRHLLAAVAKAESGRWDETNRANVAWPWTVTAGGEGQFFASAAEAITEVKRLKARGVTNIDVGCMQVNLFHHGRHFAGIEQAMDPEANADYAARFLKTLRETSADWMEAAGRYHSSTPEKNAPYRAKIARLWDETKRENPAAPPAAQLARAPGQGSGHASIPAAAGAILRSAGPRAVVAIDYDRTARLNANFQARRAANTKGAAESVFVGGNEAGAIANRARKEAERARAINARVVAPGTPAAAERFAQRRANDIARWRTNEFARPGATDLARPGATKPVGDDS